MERHLRGTNRRDSFPERLAMSSLAAFHVTPLRCGGIHHHDYQHMPASGGNPNTSRLFYFTRPLS